MASRRFIDRGFWKCRELNQANTETRLLFVYLFGEEVDDFGRVKDDPYLMRRGCFSDDDVSEAEVRAMLDALIDAGLVKRYLARDETPLLWLPTFHDYQPMGYWAISRLDRHPDDEFEAFDWIGPRGKKIKTPRPLSPIGHEYGILHNPTESGISCRNPTEVDTPIPIPIPIPKPVPTSSPSRRRRSPEGNMPARRSMLGANVVPGNTPGSTATDTPPTPDNVAEADWRRLLAITAKWPDAGRDGGTKRLGAMLAANGPKDAERRVRMVDDAWRTGKLTRPGKPGLPWGVLGRSGYDPPDEEPTPGRGRGEPEEIGSLLAKVGSGCDPPDEG